MTNKFMRKRDKIRAQMKSRWYYSFWGAATVAVVAGQIYVGSGYRALAKSLDKWMDVAVEALINDYKSRGRYTPIVPPPTGDWRKDFGGGVVYLEDLDPDDYILWKEIDADK